MFILHPTLEADTHTIGRLTLCRILLMNNSQLPWIILVPERPGVRESYELSTKDQLILLGESNSIGKHLMNEFNGDKLNVASLGNLVPQLHVHHIVRFNHDPVWPNPVWGNLTAKPFTKAASLRMIKRLQKRFSTDYSDFSPA